jgi:hypothetical protein
LKERGKFRRRGAAPLFDSPEIFRGKKPGCKAVTSLDGQGCIGSVSGILFKVRKTCASETISTPFWGVQRGETPLGGGLQGVSPLYNSHYPRFYNHLTDYPWSLLLKAPSVCVSFRENPSG